MGRRKLLQQGIAAPGPVPKPCEVEFPCPLCHPTTEAVGLERGRDRRIIALQCPSCGHSWYMPLSELERRKAINESTSPTTQKAEASDGTE